MGRAFRHGARQPVLTPSPCTPQDIAVYTQDGDFDLEVEVVRV
jgi:hypothetical protein